MSSHARAKSAFSKGTIAGMDEFDVAFGYLDNGVDIEIGGINLCLGQQ